MTLRHAPYRSNPLSQVIYQAKTLSTALFSVIVLGKSFSCEQWVSFAILALGVILVQASSSEHAMRSIQLCPAWLCSLAPSALAARGRQGRAAPREPAPRHRRRPQRRDSLRVRWGLPRSHVHERRHLALGECYPRQPLSVPWALLNQVTLSQVRNVQLALFSIPLQLFAIWRADLGHIRHHGLFHGFHTSTWAVVLVQFAGGV